MGWDGMEWDARIKDSGERGHWRLIDLRQKLEEPRALLNRLQLL